MKNGGGPGGRPRIAVVGSMVMDLVFRAKTRPRPGETLQGDDFQMFLGGKGFNQAVACHRLGAEVTLIGRIGSDRFGDMFLEKLAHEGISSEHISRDPEVGTAVASPVVFPDGQNSIIGVPRANLRLSAEQVQAAEPAIAAADLLMLQFEVAPAASAQGAEIARSHGRLVLLDPAPAHLEPNATNWPVDYLAPNEVEAEMLAGRIDPSSMRPDSGKQGIDRWAQAQLNAGLKAVVMSIGVYGAVVYDKLGYRSFPGFTIQAVDSTGAGDAFRAGLAVMLAQGRDIDDAVRFANACGALACTVMGAEPSMPRAEAVRRFLEENRR